MLHHFGLANGYQYFLVVSENLHCLGWWDTELFSQIHAQDPLKGMGLIHTALSWLLHLPFRKKGGVFCN